MIDVDTSEPLHRSAAELEAFVRAIVAGLEPDEGQWLECKSTLDLASAHGRFHVGRAILGFANRMPAAARQWCQGWAYVVVGVEPGDVAGIQLVDDTDLLRWVSAYIGPSGDAPEWTPEWVELDGRYVLVAAVAPPQPGATIWTLRKTYTETVGKKTTTTPEVTIFVRNETATRPATTAQIRALVERARDPDVQLRVQCESTLALAWLDEAASRTEIGEWVAAQRQATIEQHPDLRPPTPRSRQVRGIDDTSTSAMSMLEATTQYMAAARRYGAGPKSVTAFRAEVDEWAALLQAATWSRLRAAFDRRAGIFVLRMVNESNAHLEGVKVVVGLPAGVRARNQRRLGSALPDVPEPYQPFVTGLVPPLATRWSPLELDDVIPPGRGSDVTIYVLHDGRQQLVYDLADLRRGHPEHTAAVWLDVDPGLAGHTVELRWRATVARPQAWDLTGTVTVDVAQAPVTFVDLCDAVEAAER